MRKANALIVSICSCDTRGTPRPTAPIGLSIMDYRLAQCLVLIKQVGDVSAFRRHCRQVTSKVLVDDFAKFVLYTTGIYHGWAMGEEWE